MVEESTREKSKALVIAVTNRSLEQVTACLAKGADVHYESDLALRYAAYLGYTDIVEALLNKGANVHADNETPLFIAIKAKDEPLMDLLVAKGADVQAVLDKRKTSLTKEDLTTVAEIKARAAKAAFEKNAAILRNSTQGKKRPTFKPKAP